MLYRKLTKYYDKKLARYYDKRLTKYYDNKLTKYYDKKLTKYDKKLTGYYDNQCIFFTFSSTLFAFMYSSSVVSAVIKTFVSSANNINLTELPVLLIMSLKYIIKNKGPRTLLGFPLST